jgi:hypothetical protein
LVLAVGFDYNPAVQDFFLRAGDSVIWKLNCWDSIDGTIEVGVAVGARGRSISTVFTIISKASYWLQGHIIK